VADVAMIAILGASGKFGGVRAGNASLWATRGATGLFAPGIAFGGPIYLHNVNAMENASPMLVIGSASDTEIAGGDLAQTNAKSVRVAGISRLSFVAGISSQGDNFPAQTNRARLEQDGRDVTSDIVSGPP
jgi:hypothetical protein